MPGRTFACVSVEEAPTVPADEEPSDVAPPVDEPPAGEGLVVALSGFSAGGVLLVESLISGVDSVTEVPVVSVVTSVPLVDSVEGVVVPDSPFATVVLPVVSAVDVSVGVSPVGDEESGATDCENFSAGGTSTTVEMPVFVVGFKPGTTLPPILAESSDEREDEPLIGLPGKTTPFFVVTVVSVVASGAGVVPAGAMTRGCSPVTRSASLGTRVNSLTIRLAETATAEVAAALTAPSEGELGTVVVAERLRNTVCPSAEYKRPVSFTLSELLFIVMLSSTNDAIRAGSLKACKGATLNVSFDKMALALGVVGCDSSVFKSSEVATPSCTARIKTGLKRRTSSNE